MKDPDVTSSQIEPNNLWDDVPFAPIVVLVLEAFELCTVADGFSNKSNFLQKIVLVGKYQIPTILIYGVHGSSGLTLLGWSQLEFEVDESYTLKVPDPSNPNIASLQVKGSLAAKALFREFILLFQIGVCYADIRVGV